METLSFALSIAAILMAIYYFVLKNRNIFKKHGIPYIPSIPLLGNYGPLFSGKSSMSELLQQVYNTNSEALYVGIQDFRTPVIMLRDIDLIKTVTVTNVESFTDHSSFIEKKLDPLLGGIMFLLKGEEWRHNRSMATPAFTSSKIKSMFPLISICATGFADYLSKLRENEREIELKTLLSKYTNDVITSCAFGVSVDSNKDPNNPFYVHGRNATKAAPPKISLKFMLYRHAPWISRALNLRLVEKDSSDFFFNVISSTVKAREEQGIPRLDMIQLLMEARNKKEPGKGLTTDDIARLAFSFFLGGFHTTSSQLSSILHHLAANPDVQERLQQETDQVLEDTQGQVTYDAITNMEYLDAVINESMRLMPVPAFVDRLCTKRFELPPPLAGGKPFIVEPGMTLWVPVYPIHHDPKYYDDPEKFDPERFLTDGRRIMKSGTFLPFGIGPRMCIGNRFALIQMKLLVFHLLSRCDVKRSSKTGGPSEQAKGLFSLIPKNGFWVKIEPKKSPHPLADASMTNGTCKAEDY